MKRLMLLLVLLLFLTGCVSRPDAVPTESGAGTETELPASVTPQPENTVPEDTEPPTPPEETAPETEYAAPLSLPWSVYCYEDTAISADGTILLQLPGYQLTTLLDFATGLPRGILALKELQITALYDLSGALWLDNLSGTFAGCTGDLFWHGAFGSQTLVRLSNGKVLYENLSLIRTAESYVIIQPAFWNSPCVLLDSYGNEVQTLDRGFRLTAVYPDNGTAFLSMEAKNGSRMLIDTQGQTRLPAFCLEVLSVSNQCAVILQGTEYQLIDLQTQDILFRHDQEFSYFDGTILTTDSQHGVTLMDLQGNTLLQMTEATPADPNGDGIPDLILGAQIADEHYQTLVLKPDGTSVLTLDAAPRMVLPLSDTFVFRIETVGAGMLQEGFLVNLETGEEMRVVTGPMVSAASIMTSEGLLFLVSSQNGGRLLRPDGMELFSCARTRYIGGDVFFCEDEGLRAWDGSWLWMQSASGGSV